MTRSTTSVLITGAAGFIGYWLSRRLLDNGHTVVGLDNFCDFYSPAIKRDRIQSLQQHRGFSFYEADIRNQDQVERLFRECEPRTVVHIAAMAGVRPSIENPLLYSDVNIQGTMQILEATKQFDCEKIIFASSSSVYGNNEKIPFAETDLVDNPISPYAATKRAGELLCYTHWKLTNMPVACMRFFTVYGPSQRPDLAISKFLKLISEGKPIPMFGNGSTSRDYTYIDDIVDGILASLYKVDTYRIYNLGGSSPVTLTELIQTIGRVVGKEPILDHQPPQPGDVERTFADLSRSRAELGYNPKVSLEEGIRRQWDFMNQISQ